ncbi:predicted protein [Nematostella vectensis]|uniref:Uncharacterized protein n=1 Tax=Nematostella vectensis TaxID=45351 RepID=A7SHD9_NEMVE|nr:predicted protein [Nematostella vectensis]|eukprot:XP_001628938.1 predicted protein [Nematostella vectensis]
MGHSASIAKKYQAPKQHVDDTNDEVDSLATVSSFRPTSPDAHNDARQFILTPPQQPHRLKTQNHYGYPVYGSLPLGYRTHSLGNRSAYSNTALGYPHSGVYPYATIGSTPFRSMHEVRHYLAEHPDLLSGKRVKNGYKNHPFHDIEEQQKQIKTKQKVYLGLLDPPVVYGYGVDREKEKQLKVKQKLYLQLVTPTVNNIEYYMPGKHPRVPLRNEEMVVVRKDDSIKNLPQEKSRTPLPVIRGKQAVLPEIAIKSSLKQPPQQMQVRREPANGGSINGISQINALQSITPQGAIPRRRVNEYTEMNTPGLARSGKSQKQRKHEDIDEMEVIRKYNSLGKSSAKPEPSDDVVFTYDVEELGLKKKTASRENAAPLYLKKSLAYNPRQNGNRDILSDPL